MAIQGTLKRFKRMLGLFEELTVTGTATLPAVTTTTLSATGNVSLGDAAADEVGFHGVTGTGATQRANTIQVSTVCAASYISVSTNLAAWAAEVHATLTSKGLWKGAA